jgi:hypothetical protein
VIEAAALLIFVVSNIPYGAMDWVLSNLS